MKRIYILFQDHVYTFYGDEAADQWLKNKTGAVKLGPEHPRVKAAEEAHRIWTTRLDSLTQLPTMETK